MSATGSPTAGPSKITVPSLRKARDGERLVMVTAYDHPSARLADQAGVDAILVGDSLGMVVLGYASTLSVTMDDMIHHAKAVARGARRPLLIGDMPFMSYQTSVADALRNAGRFLQEAQMDAVKLEGGQTVAPLVRALTEVGIPVMGHVGLTPQHIHALGGYRVQGRTVDAARRLLEDAVVLEDAGCFALVIEGVPERLATFMTERLGIPTVGIGAGAGTDGQVLVLHDLLGLWHGPSPRFVKRYGAVGDATLRALTAFRDEVRDGTFPAPEHTYRMKDEAWEGFLEAVERTPLTMVR